MRCFTFIITLGVLSMAILTCSASNVHFIRHGESTWNVAGKLQGQGTIGEEEAKEYQDIFSTKNPETKLRDSAVLTEKGKKQAQKLGENIKATLSGKSIVLISSDLLRCKGTTEIVQQILESSETKVVVKYDARLREADHGILSGMKSGEYKKIESYQKREQLDAEGQFRTAMDPDNGENYETVAIRAHEAVLEAIKEFPDQEIYVVTHGGPMKALYTYLTMNSAPFSDESNISSQIKNCAVMTVQGYDSKPSSEIKIVFKEPAKSLSTIF